jgi:outer membrane lipoprotein SlyB
MDIHPTPPSRNTAGHHPLMILAALAVLLFCLVGIAAVMGWLPSSIGSNPANRQLSESDRMALASNMSQSAPAVATPLTPLQPAPAPAAPQPAPQPMVSGEPLAQQYSPQPAYPADQQAYPAAQPYERDAVPARAPAPIRERAPARLAAAETSPHWCGNCGNIESIHTITSRARGSGFGAGAGAILGGLLGHQVGGGNGRQLATVAGAVGGAVVGNQVEGNMHAVHSYEIRVRLDDGTLRTFHQNSAPAWRTGERVRIVKGRLHTA